MPDRIHLMSASLANLIAAGEVVERPASVVKELVENSIDAGATHIDVELIEGGLKQILVRDDGCGMNRDDAKMCLLRHASSKIKSSYDLEYIHTMGFRGEAIPSIVSVSNFEMETSDGEEGTKVEASGENQPLFFSAPLRKGTVIRVKDLFYNTPARLKYMKGANTEKAKCIDTCEHLALGFPNVSFTFKADGKEVFSTSGRGDEVEVIQRIWGNGIAKEMNVVSKESVRDFKVKVFMANPEVNYSTKYQIMTFLNNRFIYSYKLSKGIEEAYRDYLAPLRYPFVVVRIEADPTLVDVNVHPAKREVRISGEDHLAYEIKSLIADELLKNKPTYTSRSSSLYFAKENKEKELNATPLFNNSTQSNQIQMPKVKGAGTFSPAPSYESQIISDVATNTFQGNDPSEINRLINMYKKTSVEKNVLPTENRVTLDQDTLEEKEVEQTIDNKIEVDTNEDKKVENKKVSPYADLCPIGQVAKTYIICESPEGLCIMDQHAAAERINFEKFERLFKEGVKLIQPLSPIIVELPPSVVSSFDDNKAKLLKDMGLIVSVFGDSALKLDEVPSFLTDKDYDDVLKDIIVGVMEGRKEDPLALMRKAVSTIACKASIRAGQILSPIEQVSLIKNLGNCDNPANCPHGRPTVIKISIRDLERLFKRTGF